MYSQLTMLWQFQVNSKGTQPYIYMYSFSLKPPFPSRLAHDIKQSSLCYTISPCWWSILNTAVWTWASQSPSLSFQDARMSFQITHLEWSHRCGYLGHENLFCIVLLCILATSSEYFLLLLGPYHFCPLLSPSLHECSLGISNFLEFSWRDL